MLPVIGTVASRCYPLFFKGEWNPSKIDGCVLWLRADSLGLADGQQVATWEDGSGKGNDVAQSTAGKRPLYYAGQVNGQPAVFFDGSDDFLTGSMNNLPEQCTLIAVTNIDSEETTGGIVAVTTGSINVGYRLANNTATLQLRAGNGVAAQAVASASDARNAWHVITGWINQTGSTATDFEYFIDGSSDKLYDAASVDMSAITTTTVHIGTLGDGINWPLKGYIAEIVVYDSALGPSDRGLVESYLLSRYGI